MKYICDALVHPDGPKDVTLLSLEGSRASLSTTFTFVLLLAAGIKEEGAQSLHDALIHPQGLVHLTSLNLTSSIATSG